MEWDQFSALEFFLCQPFKVTKRMQEEDSTLVLCPTLLLQCLRDSPFCILYHFTVAHSLQYKIIQAYAIPTKQSSVRHTFCYCP